MSEEQKKVNLIPDFLYIDNGVVKSGVRGDSNVDEEWKAWEHKQRMERMKFAKSYHQHKLSEITDKVIEKEFATKDGQSLDYNNSNLRYRVGAKWLLNKLKG